MKLLTWNVNGLRAVLGKGAWEVIQAQTPDVVCLQEIKARPEQLNAAQQALFSSYHCTWNPAQRLGYSGVATICREEPCEIETGCGADLYDVEGRVVHTRFQDFHLFNIYFPSGQRDYGRVLFKLDFYQHMLGLFDRLHAQGENIIVCGDFNTAHQEIDLRNPKQNVKTSGFMPEERAWVDKYVEHGFVDAYRHLYPDRVQYTWWSMVTGARQRNVGWRLDYFLVSKTLVDRVKDVIIHDDITGSDHCPVTLVLD